MIQLVPIKASWQMLPFWGGLTDSASGMCVGLTTFRVTVLQCIAFTGLTFSSADMGAGSRDSCCSFGQLYPLLHSPKQSRWMTHKAPNWQRFPYMLGPGSLMFAKLKPAVFPRAVKAASSPDEWHGNWMCLLLHSMDRTQSCSHCTGQYYFYWFLTVENSLCVLCHLENYRLAG